MSHNKQVLIVAYLFPPSGGAGVQRTTKFVKYLPEFGWQPVILTVKSGWYRLKDQTLNAEIPPDITTHRTSSLQLPLWFPWRVRNWVARWLLIVDEHLGWYPFAVRKARELIDKANITAIYTTSAPYTDHLIGYALKRRYRLPWIVDLRDPWIGNFSRHHPTRLHRRLDARLEALVIRNADQVLVTSPTTLRDMLGRYPDQVADKFTLLTNGYDQADFNDVVPISLPDDCFTILYSGSFYSRGLTPNNFLLGLTNALEKKSLPRARIQVLFVGNISQQIKDTIDHLGLSDLVKTTGYLPHQESIAYLLAANLLLLIVGNSPNSTGVLPGKIFEYLAASNPIMVLAPDGAATEIIREAQAGVIVPPDDVHAISDAIVDMYTRWEQGRLEIIPRPEVVARYERRNQTAWLASLLDQISTPETIP